VATWLAMARELRWPLTAAATLLVVLAGLLGTGYWLRASALESRLTSVNHELQRTLKVRPPLTSVTINAAMGRVQEQLAKLRKDREAVAYLDRYHYDTLNLFKDLSQVVHDQTGITVDAMSFTQDRLLLSGTSPSYTEAEALRNRIGAMPRFKGRTVKVTNSNVGQQIRYRLTVER